MNQNKAILIREYFATQSNHWFFFLMVLIYFAQEKALPGFWDVLCWLLLGLIPLILYLVRDLNMIVPMIFFHVLAMFDAAVLPLSSNTLRGIFFFFSMAYVAASLLRYLSNSARPTRIVPLYVTLPLYFLVPTVFSMSGRMEVVFFPYCAAMSLSAVMFFLTYYVDKYLHFVTANEHTASSMPGNEIFDSGVRVAGGYMLAGSGVLLLLSLIAVPAKWYRSFWLALKELIRKALRFLLGLFQPLPNSDMIDGAGNKPLQEILPDDPSPVTFWQNLESFIQKAGGILLLLLAAFLIYKLIKYLGGLRKPEKMTQEELLETAMDTHERLSPKRSALYEEDESRLSIRQRIRRLYRRKAQAVISDPKLLLTITAREFAAGQDNPALADIYEKARYSNAPCDKQDLKTMQLAYRRKKSDE